MVDQCKQGPEAVVAGVLLAVTARIALITGLSDDGVGKGKNNREGGWTSARHQAKLAVICAS